MDCLQSLLDRMHVEQGFEYMLVLKERNKQNPQVLVSNNAQAAMPCSKNVLSSLPVDMQRQNSVKDSTPRISLNLTHKTALHSYIINALKLIRQVPCKAIAKVWIKVIEPKKKTRYPYVKGNCMKPGWWPDNVEHREPDHLHKDDRLRLMTTIMMEVIPNMKHSHDQIMEELEKCTFVIGIFNKDATKRKIMQSIFNITRALCGLDPSVNQDGTVTVIDVDKLSKTTRPTSAYNDLQATPESMEPSSPPAEKPQELIDLFNLDDIKSSFDSPLTDFLFKPIEKSTPIDDFLSEIFVVSSPTTLKSGIMP